MTALVIRADAAHLPLPDASVDLIVTSPPYYGLRSYTDGGEHYQGQIGSEVTPAEYVAALVACTAEWMRVLKPSGSLFVNLGDKYSTGNSGDRNNSFNERSGNAPGAKVQERSQVRSLPVPGMQPKSLLGLPWRYALAAVDQLGLILRAEIIWAKPNGLPESVTDRVRRAHEQMFHFTRQPRYYSAVDEIREPQQSLGERHNGRSGYVGAPDGIARSFTERALSPLGKLPGSVWQIPSQPLTVPPELGVDHFAAFPMELPRRIIQGWSPPGICTACGEGRRPVSDIDRLVLRRLDGERSKSAVPGKTNAGGYRGEVSRIITGYVCACTRRPHTHLTREGEFDCHEQDCDVFRLPPTGPAVVLDPFGGTGTTALLASALGRIGISVDMSGDYCRLARWRTTDPGERARALEVDKPPAQVNGQGELFEMAGN